MPKQCTHYLDRLTTDKKGVKNMKTYFFCSLCSLFFFTKFERKEILKMVKRRRKKSK